MMLQLPFASVPYHYFLSPSFTLNQFPLVASLKSSSFIHQSKQLRSFLNEFILFILQLVCAGKSHSIFTLSFSSTFSGVYSYQLAAIENMYLLHITQWAITPALSCHHRQYCFCASILHSAATWLIASSLSLHNLHRGETLLLINIALYAVCFQNLVLCSH